MKIHKLFAFILLALVVQSCGDDEEGKKNLFSINTSAMKQHYSPNETLNLQVNNTKNKAIDSIVYYINNKRAGKVNRNESFTATLNESKFGYKNIKALIFYAGSSAEAEARIELVSDIEPELLEYEIVNTYSHNIDAYTQGLEFYRDTLIEGTGQYEFSKLRKVNYKDGLAYKETRLDKRYFGEGITVFNNKVYQLTWRESTTFIYDANTFKKLKEIPYTKKFEGWGLTNDGEYLYQSDGTEKIWKLDPENMEVVDYINVYTKTTKIKAVNELEWIDGKIYGNVYMRDAVAVIDPVTGAVEGIINFAELKSKVTQHPKLDVLNGIAYNPKTKTIFVTGKNWDKMFEIRIKE